MPVTLLTSLCLALCDAAQADSGAGWLDCPFPDMLSHRKYSLQVGMRAGEFLSRINQYPVAECAMNEALAFNKNRDY